MIRMHVSHPPPNYLQEQSNRETMFRTHLSPKTANYHKICTKMTVQFPELRLIQYDCGKYMNEYKTTEHVFKFRIYLLLASIAFNIWLLAFTVWESSANSTSCTNTSLCVLTSTLFLAVLLEYRYIILVLAGKLQTLDILLHRLKTEDHRVLIFTQMTRMLDILEAFLNYHGHRYLRLDGTTKIEQRQVSPCCMSIWLQIHTKMEYKIILSVNIWKKRILVSF